MVLFFRVIPCVSVAKEIFELIYPCPSVDSVADNLYG